MRIIIGYMITTHIDNVGVIFFSENKPVLKYKYAIDVHNHFIWDYFEYGMVKIKFVYEYINTLDKFTKNLKSRSFFTLT